MRQKLVIALFITGVASLGLAQSGLQNRGERSLDDRSRDVINAMTVHACLALQRFGGPGAQLSTPGASISLDAMRAACSGRHGPEPAPELRKDPAKDLADADGTLLRRRSLIRQDGVVVELIAYASTGLVVGGVLCYPDDGKPRSTVLHLHGGLGGIFVNPDGNLLETCINWAVLHDRTAFAPSYRGQDGGEGHLELCLGETNDVANAAIMLRSLRVVDPERVAMVGGSIGGCVALRSAPKIPNLKAVVAYVPPSDWKQLVDFHRNEFSPAVETNCDGDSVVWDIGGPALADTFDSVMCGHAYCTAKDYQARSTIPAAYRQSAPTLIISASSDNIVPPGQQLLYSLVRQQLGNPVEIYGVDPCGAPTAPVPAFDVHVAVTGTYHALSPATISSGLLFLMNALDN